jgi:hypothetical protein
MGKKSGNSNEALGSKDLEFLTRYGVSLKRANRLQFMAGKYF